MATTTTWFTVNTMYCLCGSAGRHVAVTFYKRPRWLKHKMARNRSAPDNVLAPGAFNRDATLILSNILK